MQAVLKEDQWGWGWYPDGILTQYEELTCSTAADSTSQFGNKIQEEAKVL